MSQKLVHLWESSYGVDAAAAVASVMSNPVRPHGQQPTRLLCPWDSPGKNIGVGCYSLLQCKRVKSESEVAQSCPTLQDPMDCSLPGSSVHGIFQARVLELVAITFPSYTVSLRKKNPTITFTKKCIFTRRMLYESAFHQRNRTNS